MTDMTWLANEAKTIHETFVHLFYGLTVVLLLLGVFTEYFKWPLGGIPSFSTLVGRALLAAIMLHTFTDVLNTIGDLSDSFAKELGDLNQIHLVLAKSSQKLHSLTWSMLSVKEGLILAISFISFFILYLSVHLADASMVYVWTLAYVFSPILIALYILPQTSGATKALYRSIVEVSFWKVVWSVLATLLWSAALSDMNKPGHDISFISAVLFNLMLAFSLAATPKVVHALAQGGLSTIASGLSALAAAFATGVVVKLASQASKGTGKLLAMGFNASVSGATRASSKYFPKAEPYMRKVPLIRRPPPRPSFFVKQPKSKHD